MASNTHSKKQELSPWMDKILAAQLSTERDFPLGTPITYRYAILCTHRSGSTLLSEGLYRTGMAGDPMEFFNLRMLRKLCVHRGVKSIQMGEYIAEMNRRRTSPNGVFGFNLKFDQYKVVLGQQFSSMIKHCDYVIFLHRKDKIRQAISQYIGNMRDTFRIPAEADYKTIAKLVSDVPFNPDAISQLMRMAISQEQSWLEFLRANHIDFEPIAYEDLAQNYEASLDHILSRLGVPEDMRIIPQPPTLKISAPKNDELYEKFSAYISGEKALFQLIQ